MLPGSFVAVVLAFCSNPFFLREKEGSRALARVGERLVEKVGLGFRVQSLGNRFMLGCSKFSRNSPWVKARSHLNYTFTWPWHSE